jgi:surface antigen
MKGMVINQVLYMPERIRTLISTIFSKATCLVSLSLLVMSSTLAICVSISSVAHADTLGYPWPTDTQAPCYYGASGGSSCVNPADPTNQNYWYSWGVYDANGTFHFYRSGYEYRNCTDYVQWKESQSPINVSVPGTWGNGGQWYGNAPSNERSTTPKAWDAAVVPGTVGHVAFVESVSSDGSQITVSEYNHDQQGHGDTWTGTPSSRGFTEYVDFGVHPAQTTTYSVLGVTSHSNGENDVFWKDSSNNLTEAYWNGSAWSGPIALGTYGFSSLASAPTTVVQPSTGYTDVFWRGASNNLWQAVWTGSAWAGPWNLGMGTVASQPSAVALGSQVNVYWTDTNHNLEETYWNGSTWSAPINLSPYGFSSLNSAPSASIQSSGENDVFWVDASGNLKEAVWTGSAWAGPFTVPVGTVSSTPTAVWQPSSGYTDVFWKDSSNNLEETYWNGTAWSGPTNLSPYGFSSLATAPSATAWGSQVAVYWTDSSGNLIEAFWNGTAWAGPLNIGMGPIPN